MKVLAPKPIIALTLRAWHVPPGMTFALVEDMERHLWIVESCPAGTRFWTLEQAAELSKGSRTRPVLQAAVREGRQRENAKRIAPSATCPFQELTTASEEILPSLTAQTGVNSYRALSQSAARSRRIPASGKTLTRI